MSIVIVLIIIVYFFLVLNAMGAVMLDNRQPVKTIAWILVILLVPVVGLLFYYFFGQNLRREYLFNKQSMDQLAHNLYTRYIHQETFDIPERYSSLVQFSKKNSFALPFMAEQIDMFIGGGEFIDHLVKDISAARHHVHLEFFIIEDDRVGNQVADAMIGAARRGVEARLLYDDVGCWNVHRHFFLRMKEGGVEVVPYQPVHFRSLSHKVNYRNHRKLAVIDGHVGYIGGMNLADRYVDGENGGIWHDMHLRLTGPAVYGQQAVFLGDWYVASGKIVTGADYYPSMPALERKGVLLQTVASAPLARWSTIMMAYNWIIQNARKSILIQTPYFMPTETILESLQTAAMRGVKVQVMVPRKPGGFWMTWANESFYGDVLKAGVEIYAYNPGMLHAKCLIADDDFCSIGSVNMDFRSLVDTFEDSAFIYDVETTSRVRTLFEEARRNCTRIDLDMWKGRSRRRRLIESFVKIFSPLF